jgi:DNA-binding response OmpR family regulator
MVFKERNILVIDDSPGIRTFLNVSFGGDGAHIHEAPTAGEGIQMFRDVKPDVVILDLGLPDKDGLDVLPDLRALDEDQSSAIIVLTVRNDTYTRMKAKERGANGYVTKPFMMDELYDCIEDALKS